MSGSNAAAAYSSSSSSAFCLHTAMTAAPPPTPPPIMLPVPAPHKSCRRWFRCRRDRTRSAHITAAAATADTMVTAKRPATTGVSRKWSLPPAPTADEPVKSKLNNNIYMIVYGAAFRKKTQVMFGLKFNYLIVVNNPIIVTDVVKEASYVERWREVDE